MNGLRCVRGRIVALLLVSIAIVAIGPEHVWSQTKSKPSKPRNQPGTAKFAPKTGTKKKSAKKPAGPKPVIVFENRTYSQLRYKLDGGAKWKTLMPAARR